MPKIHKAYKAATVAVVGMIVFILLLTVLMVAVFVFFKKPTPRTFTVERWKVTEESQRYRYVESLERQYKFEGATKEVVEDILGEDTRDELKNGTGYMEYRVQKRPFAGWRVYQIQFKNGVVTGTNTVSED